MAKPLTREQEKRAMSNNKVKDERSKGRMLKERAGDDRKEVEDRGGRKGAIADDHTRPDNADDNTNKDDDDDDDDDEADKGPRDQDQVNDD
jgi:hypothetical protein